MGAFAAHLQAWQTVASMGSPAITILEDDAKFVHPIPEGLPEDKITLLGGVFKGYGKWDGPAQRAYAEGKFIEEFAEFRQGVNEIPKGMRWVMAVAYHLPAGMAKKLVDIVEQTKKKTLKSPGVWLNNYATHFVFPPPFVDQASPSQCITPVGCHGSNLLRQNNAQRCQ